MALQRDHVASNALASQQEICSAESSHRAYAFADLGIGNGLQIDVDSDNSTPQPCTHHDTTARALMVAVSTRGLILLAER